ncbi:MAG: hypothetical protein Q7S74_05140 [Nanoarchaeota archaeon]|nr:hypothetical protein [Nanoarchaeota archaeon]
MNQQGKTKEFFMHLGGAILVAILAIGILAYFGIFSSGKYITGSAVVNPPFYVDAWNVQADTGSGKAGIVLELKNNGKEDYNIESVSVSGCGSYSRAIPITKDSLLTISIDCGTSLVVDEIFKGDVMVVYRKIGSSIDLTSLGEIDEKITS